LNDSSDGESEFNVVIDLLDDGSPDQSFFPPGECQVYRNKMIRISIIFMSLLIQSRWKANSRN